MFQKYNKMCQKPEKWLKIKHYNTTHRKKRPLSRFNSLRNRVLCKCFQFCQNFSLSVVQLAPFDYTAVCSNVDKRVVGLTAVQRRIPVVVLIAVYDFSVVFTCRVWHNIHTASTVIYNSNCVARRQTHVVTVCICKRVKWQNYPAVLSVAVAVSRMVTDITNTSVFHCINLICVSVCIYIRDVLNAEKVL